jgi:hypothetical protein
MLNLRPYFGALALLTVAGCDASARDESAVAPQPIADSGPGGTIHAIGIYEAQSDHSFGSHPEHPVKIYVHEQGDRKIQLALSSYEPVVWEIEGPGAGSVDGVYIDGHNRHRITGVDGARITNLSGPEGSSSSATENYADDWGAQTVPSEMVRIGCAYTYPEASGGGCEAGRNFLWNAQQLFGRGPRTYTGTYQGDRFEIRP